MAISKENLRSMIDQIDTIIERARQMEKDHAKRLSLVHPKYQRSARNLLFYWAMRRVDMRDLQKNLGNLGLSRLAKAEAHVMYSLLTNRTILESLLNDVPVHFPTRHLTPKQTKLMHKSNAKNLLGYRSRGRRARIMVTLPSDAADDYSLVEQMIANGMDCARINCAHDNPAVWKQMVDHVRKAEARLKNQVRICMDLGGPKIRTGQIEPGPKVQKYRPAKDTYGRIPTPLTVWLGPNPHPSLHYPHIPIAEHYLRKIHPGDQLRLRDTRDKKRSIHIISSEEEGAFGEISRTTYLSTGTILTSKSSSHETIQVGELPAIEQSLRLLAGDQLRITNMDLIGAPARYDEDGDLVECAHIPCTAPEVFSQVKVGEPILFDDGKISGVIEEVDASSMTVRIKRTGPGGGRLRADKGINLPASKLSIAGLTSKDREDLAFVAEHADVVNFSFVNTAQDVRELIEEIDRLGARDRLGIILKIETQRGFDNLLDILLEAMRVYPIGVMIARGDLAIETGWENMGRIQEEILFLCRAAHISDIWATQVLENLAKSGIPSRAEITDAAMAQRADCVMLNKGPYILQAIRLLNTMLKDLAKYQDKNAPMLPPL